MLLLLTFPADAADGRPKDDAACDALAAWYTANALPPAELAPTEWWLATPPCPPARDLIGAAPPRARDVSCTLGGQRDGPQTMFSETGGVLLETTWSHGAEVGPRREYDRDTGKIVRVTPMKAPRDGEVLQWTPEGAVTLTTFVRGVKSGPALEVDAGRALVRIEHWKNDQRHGRSCGWKDGALETDQLYKAGAVTD